MWFDWLIWCLCFFIVGLGWLDLSMGLIILMPLDLRGG